MCPYCYAFNYANKGHFFNIHEAYDLIEVMAQELIEGDRDNETYFVYKCKECSEERLTYHICKEHMGGAREIYL